MKKIWSFFSILIVLVTLSCGSTKGTVWDDSVPAEQSAKIMFLYFEPTSYNRILVNKKDFRVVFIPAGPAEFGGDIAWYSYGGNTKYIFESKDAAFTCKLEAGEEYWAVVTYKRDEEKKRRVWGINLYKDEIKVRVGYPSEDKLVAFIPFDPPVVSN